jgi:dTDP-4-dehydrorhamnose reductase
MSKIVITGAKGMLGRELCNVLSKNNEVTGIDCVSAEDQSSRSVYMLTIDITQPEAIIQAICSLSPNMVIHTAAYKDVDGCERDPQKAHFVNGYGTKNVAEAAQKCGASFLYISTDYIFDGKKTSPYNEDDIPSPINIYGNQS